MAVYTHITHAELEEFLAAYDLGVLERFEGIAQGVSNTNYHVFTDQGRYILTLFEEHRTARDDLPYLFGYAGHLAANGVPCPQAYLDRQGACVGTLKGKAAALVKFLPGRQIERGQTKTKYCAEMGRFLGQMHVAAGNDFAMQRDNDWGQQAFHSKAEPLRAQMDGFKDGLEAFIMAELDYLDAHWPAADKPKIAVHLDLFPDNIFFGDNERICAMIDMYFAAHDLAAFDLAIVSNAWCFADNGHWRRPAFRRLVQNYEASKALEAWEVQAFQTLCRGACMRFLLSRLEEWFAYDPDKTDMKPHDPKEYIAKLRFHQNNNVLDWHKLA